MSVLACGCHKTADYSAYLSGLRRDILHGETENFDILAFLETRESPYIYDGICGEKQNVVIFKITPKKPISESIEIGFSIEKDYTCEMTFDNLKNAFSSEVKVDKLPSNDLDIAIKCGDNQLIATLSSVKTKDTISPNDAISAVKDYNKELFNELIESAEINVRLLYEDGTVFYFVGIITNKNTHAFLVDSVSAQILAEKVIEH